MFKKPTMENLACLMHNLALWFRKVLLNQVGFYHSQGQQPSTIGFAPQTNRKKAGGKNKNNSQPVIKYRHLT